MKAWSVITSFLRLMRSPRTPPQGPKNKTGTVFSPPAVTTRSAEDPVEAVRSRTSQPTESS